MIYLVDANVLNEPTKQTADNKVVAWLNANESNLIVDSIIIGDKPTMGSSGCGVKTKGRDRATA